MLSIHSQLPALPASRHLLHGLVLTLALLPALAGGAWAQEAPEAEGGESAPETTPISPDGALAPAPALSFYRRKHISFFYNQPQSPYNKYFYGGFTKAMPRFDYQLISLDAGEAAGDTGPDALASFLSQVKTHQQTIAGALASESEDPGEAGNLRFGDTVVTWSETRAIASAAFVFGTDWSFSPIQLSLPEQKLIEEDKEGKLDTSGLPSDAYVQIRTVTKTRTNAETKKEEEYQARELLYWKVSESSSLNFRLNVWNLAAEQPEHYHGTGYSWPLGEDHIVLASDVEAARERLYGQDFDFEQSSHLELLLETARMRELAAADPAAKYDGQAQAYLSLDPIWLNHIIGQLKARDEFRLKSEVLAHLPLPDRSQAGFGEAESAGDLGVRRRDWYELVEYVGSGENRRKQRVGFGKVRGFYERGVLMQPILLDREPEPGDQLMEYAGRNTAFTLGLGAYGSGPLAGPALSARLSFPIDGETAQAFAQRHARQDSLGIALDQALNEADGWESDFFVGLTGAMMSSRFSPENLAALDILAGWGWRYSWRQLSAGFGLGPGMLAMMPAGELGGGSSGRRWFGFGLGLLGSLNWTFSPELTTGFDLGLQAYLPTGLGWTAQSRLNFYF